MRFLALVGTVALVGALIWFTGPYVAFGAYRPFEEVTPRLVSIGLVLAFLVARPLRFLFARRHGDTRLEDALAAAVRWRSAIPNGDAVTSLGARIAKATADRLRRKEAYARLHAQPWYVVIGAQGSGKRTVLANSGLSFPLKRGGARAAWRGLGGTGNCDWWLTDRAAFITTADVPTNLPPDAAVDGSWRNLLSLLGAHRNVNGVIVAKSAQELMLQDQDALRAHARATAARLQELDETMRARLPVYLMVTKCDLITGFSDFFRGLPDPERVRAWGITFSLDRVVKEDNAASFADEFDALVSRLNAQMLTTLNGDDDTQRNARVFEFPQHLMHLRTPLSIFAAHIVAASSRRNGYPLLRGVYFTSGAVRGGSLDPVLATAKRESVEEVTGDTTRPLVATPHFINGLLADVVLNESYRTPFNKRRRLRTGLRFAAYTLATLFTLTGPVLLGLSYLRNREHVARVQTAVDTLNGIPPVARTASLAELLPRLEALRAVYDAANQYQAHPALAMRWGLFQGSSLGNAARDAYAREVENTLLPRLADRLRMRLAENSSKPDRLFVYLKAYLMLGQPQHLDKQYLQEIARLEWHASAQPQAEALAQHFLHLLDNDLLSPVPLDGTAVGRARSTLRQSSFPEMLFANLRRLYSSTDASDAVRLDLSAGADTTRVLRRKSGMPMSEPVGRIYTPPVFIEITERGAAALLRQAVQDAWVLDEPSAGAVAGAATYTREMLALYEREYIAVWDGRLKDVELVPISTLAGAKEAVAILGSAKSPLRGLLVTVDQHTFFKDKTTAADANSLSSIRRKSSEVLSQTAATANAASPGAAIASHFENIHRLVTIQNGVAPIDTTLERLRQVEQRLLGVGRAPLDSLSAAALTELTEGIQRDAAALPSPAREVIIALVSRVRDFVRAEVKRFPVTR